MLPDRHDVPVPFQLSVRGGCIASFRGGESEALSAGIGVKVSTSNTPKYWTLEGKEADFGTQPEKDHDSWATYTIPIGEQFGLDPNSGMMGPSPDKPRTPATKLV